MTTALIIICILFCIAAVLYAVTHFGTAIRSDMKFRQRMARVYSREGRRSRRTRNLSS